MAETTPAYSTLFTCLYDQPAPVVPHFSHYSVFRAIDARDIAQKPTPLPYIHDFAVIWDDDHDTRIIPVIEEMLMEGLLPGVQFIGEHKGHLTVILAAKTYWLIDPKDFASKVDYLSKAAGDSWDVRVGMIDTSPNSLRTQHQCDFQGLLGLPEHVAHAYFLLIDSMWQLGTKTWHGVRERDKPLAPNAVLPGRDRYVVRSTPVGEPNMPPLKADLSGLPQMPQSKQDR